MSRVVPWWGLLVVQYACARGMVGALCGSEGRCVRTGCGGGGEWMETIGKLRVELKGVPPSLRAFGSVLCLLRRRCCSMGKWWEECLGCAVFRSRVVVVVVCCWLWRREMLVTDSEMYIGIHGGGVFGPDVPNLMIDKIANPCSIGD